jgi:hypothetical protein
MEGVADGEAPNLTREAALPAWAPAYDSSTLVVGNKRAEP